MKTKVTINYKSGNSITIRVKEFSVIRNDANAITKVTWEGASPRPLSVGVDGIESVWSHN